MREGHHRVGTERLLDGDDAHAAKRLEQFDHELTEAVSVANRLYAEMNAAIVPEIDADKPIPYTMPAVENINGQAITLSNQLKAKGATDGGAYAGRAHGRSDDTT